MIYIIMDIEYKLNNLLYRRVNIKDIQRLTIDPNRTH